MKRLVLLTVATVLLCQPLLADQLKFGAGVYGGIDIPIVQDDQASGIAFGLKGRIMPKPYLKIEPFVNFSKFGDASMEDVEENPVGNKITSFGLDFNLAPMMGEKFNWLFFAGVGMYMLKNDDTSLDESKIGLAGGLGGEYYFSPQISLEARGRLNVVTSEDGGSRKSAAVTAGLNYHFGQ